MTRHILLALLAFMLSLPCALAQYGEIRLWEGTNVHEKGVTLLPFIAQENRFDGAAIIVCPGGSYSWLDYEAEGTDVARWLQREGISAFVLKYRVQGIFEYVTHSRAIFGGHKHPDMLEDIQRALQYVREHASRFSINPDLVGAMGFSAGGTPRDERGGFPRHGFPCPTRHPQRGLAPPRLCRAYLSSGLHVPSGYPQAVSQGTPGRMGKAQPKDAGLPFPGKTHPGRLSSRVPGELQGRPRREIPQLRITRLCPHGKADTPPIHTIPHWRPWIRGGG